MKELNYSKPFSDIFNLWKNKNNDTFELYAKKTQIKDDCLEIQPWYKNLVSKMPTFKFQLPNGLTENDFDWSLLLQMLELSSKYTVNVKFEDLSIINSYKTQTEILIFHWDSEINFKEYDVKKVSDLFISLLNEIIEMFLKYESSTSDFFEVTKIINFRTTYWNFVVTKLNVKAAVSEIISESLPI
jgi:hypothetical protein